MTAYTWSVWAAARPGSATVGTRAGLSGFPAPLRPWHAALVTGRYLLSAGVRAGLTGSGANAVAIATTARTYEIGLLFPSSNPVFSSGAAMVPMAAGDNGRS